MLIIMMSWALCPGATMEPAFAIDLYRQLSLPEGVLDDRADYIRQVRKGIPGSVVKGAIDLLGNRELFIRLLHTTSPNLSRFYKRKTLSPEDSEEVLDALRIFVEAIRIWGDIDTARTWLDTPLPALAGEKPVDLFDTFEGRRWIRQVLRRIECGEFS